MRSEFSPVDEENLERLLHAQRAGLLGLAALLAAVKDSIPSQHFLKIDELYILSQEVLTRVARTLDIHLPAVEEVIKEGAEIAALRQMYDKPGPDRI